MIKFEDQFLTENENTKSKSSNNLSSTNFRSSHSEVFLGKGVLKICSKFTGAQLCQNVVSIKLQSNFIEITLRHGCSLLYLLHIFRTPFPDTTSSG